MKKLLLISCLVLAGLVPAKADDLPKELTGTWCWSGEKYDWWIGPEKLKDVQVYHHCRRKRKNNIDT